MSRTSVKQVEILFDSPRLRVINKPEKTHFDEIIPLNSKSWADWEPANRLDFETSGCLVFTPKNYGRYFRELIRNPLKIKKFYIAGLSRVLPDFEEQKTETLYLEGFIASKYKSSKKVQYFRHDFPPNPRFWRSSQPVAMKVYKTTTFEDADPMKKFRGFRYLIQLETGARHQIRATFAAMGSGIIGDPIYSDRFDQIETPRLELHAYKLVLDIPEWDLNEKTIVCPL